MAERSLSAVLTASIILRFVGLYLRRNWTWLRWNSKIHIHGNVQNLISVLEHLSQLAVQEFERSHPVPRRYGTTVLQGIGYSWCRYGLYTSLVLVVPRTQARRNRINIEVSNRPRGIYLWSKSGHASYKWSCRFCARPKFATTSSSLSRRENWYVSAPSSRALCMLLNVRIRVHRVL